MGSDGLFDNLFDKEILSIVKQLVSPYSIEPQRIADALAERAMVVSKSKRNVDSPFQERAINEGLYYQVKKKRIFILLVYKRIYLVYIGRKSR